MTTNIKTELSNSQNRKKSIIIFLLIIPVFTCAPQQHSDCITRYQNELKMFLEPPFANSDTIELFAFRVIPETEPNSSLRILEINGKAFLEAIYLDKNIWVEQSSNLSGNTMLSHNILKKSMLVPISNSFKDKMVQSFLNVIAYVTKQDKKKSYQINDGTNYNLVSRLKNQEKEICIPDLWNNQSVYNFVSYQNYIREVIQTNLAIITDMKGKMFDQNRYIIYK